MADKLKKCKACNNEIGSKVKKCIHCGTDQRSWFGRHKVLSAIGAFFLLSFASILSSEDSPTETPVESTTEAETAEAQQTESEPLYSLGEAISIDEEFEFTLTNVSEKEVVGSDFFAKNVSEGGIFVAIDYKLKNVSEEPISSFSSPAVHLIDQKGTEYDSDIDASGSYATEKEDNNGKILSDLNPGISTNDIAVFEVSKELYDQGEWFISVDKNYKIKIK